MTEPFLRIHNRHFPECGDPPILENTDPNFYIGYFVNAFAEQWVFTYNRTTKEAFVCNGDDGWDEVFPVVDGKQVGIMELSQAPEIVLWLKACWLATHGPGSS